MPLRDADYDRRIDLLKPSGGDDGYSAVDGSFASAGKRWAKRLDVSDRERIATAQQGGDVTTRWQVRVDSLTSQLTAAWRLRHRGVEYEISGIKEINGRDADFEITSARRDD